MNKFYLKLIIIILITTFSCTQAYANNLSQAQKLLKKAKMTSVREESYDYINKARVLFEDEYENNPSNVEVLIGLSKTFQLIGDRKEAKLYVIKAYNLRPTDPLIQREMGDFYYSFQEYSTAIEYYKLALASGLLRDYETNLQTAKCYEKLGDLDNAELYYKICNHVNPKGREAMNKVNEYDSAKHPDNTEELDNAKYKYLFKSKKPSVEEQIQTETDEIIKQLSN